MLLLNIFVISLPFWNLSFGSRTHSDSSDSNISTLTFDCDVLLSEAKGYLYSDPRNISQAIELLYKADNETCYSAAFYLGIAFELLGENEKAKEWFQSSLDRSPVKADNLRDQANMALFRIAKSEDTLDELAEECIKTVCIKGKDGDAPYELALRAEKKHYLSYMKWKKFQGGKFASEKLLITAIVWYIIMNAMVMVMGKGGLAESISSLIMAFASIFAIDIVSDGLEAKKLHSKTITDLVSLAALKGNNDARKRLAKMYSEAKEKVAKSEDPKDKQNLRDIIQLGLCNYRFAGSNTFCTICSNEITYEAMNARLALCLDHQNSITHLKCLSDRLCENPSCPTCERQLFSD